MRSKSLLLLALALGCGLIASIGISQVMEGNKGPSVNKEPIYVAKHNINTGDPISHEMVVLKEWSKEDIPTGAIRELSDLEQRRPRTPIFAGEPILESKLLNPGDKGADPTQQIPQGFRIVPVSVKAHTGAAGLLRPGDRVDVQWYVARNSSLGIQDTITKTILHNVRVFAVDQSVTRAANGEEAPALAKTITLVLPPEQANKLRLAVKIGEVSLIPRHPDDQTADGAAEMSLSDLTTGDSDKNDRESEQGREDEEQGPQFVGKGFWESLSDKAAAIVTAGAAVAAAANPPKQPWEMEIVIADKVERKLFDPDTGKPIEDQTGTMTSAGGGMMTPAATPGVNLPGLPGIAPPDTTTPNTGGQSFEPFEEEFNNPEFPIQFDSAN